MLLSKSICQERLPPSPASSPKGPITEKTTLLHDNYRVFPEIDLGHRNRLIALSIHLIQQMTIMPSSMLPLQFQPESLISNFAHSNQKTPSKTYVGVKSSFSTEKGSSNNLTALTLSNPLSPFSLPTFSRSRRQASRTTVSLAADLRASISEAAI